MTDDIERRPTKRFKMKENKKFPYKKTRESMLTQLKGGKMSKMNEQEQNQETSEDSSTDEEEDE